MAWLCLCWPFIWTARGISIASMLLARIFDATAMRSCAVPFNPFSGFETVGAVEYVNYMLLQSDPGFRDPITNKATGRFIGLFEAMPPMTASFTRLRARGAFVVSSSFSRTNSHVDSVTSGTGGVSTGVGWKVGVTTILSERGEECVLRRPQSWSKAALAVTAQSTGAAVPIQWSGAGGAEFASFPTTAGETYTLRG